MYRGGGGVDHLLIVGVHLVQADKGLPVHLRRKVVQDGLVGPGIDQEGTRQNFFRKE